MAIKKRGREHTTTTETAALVVKELKKIPGIKMIAPGEIKTTSRHTTGQRFITIVYNQAGFELIISGQSVQKIAVHTTIPSPKVVEQLQVAKSLQKFAFKERSKLL